MPGFRRKPYRLPEVWYRGQRSYFLTICADQRKKVLADPRLVRVLLEVLQQQCLAHSFEVYAYCFMPDHLHLVLAGRGDSANLPLVVRAFKGAAASKARALGLPRLWQRGFYDHVIRTGEGPDTVAWYMFMNPVRAGLVQQIGEWPFSGSFVFDWRKLSAPRETFVPPWKKRP